MQTSPVITVITATFNNVRSHRADFLRQCIESVHAQTYPHIEHLIVDGASTDGTCELIREYAHFNGMKLVSEPDEGIYDAFNKGIRQAEGKYIVFLNSDDYWTNPEAVETTVRLLEQTQADFCYSHHTRVEENGELQSVDAPRLGTFFCAMPFCHQTMFTRKDVLLEMNCFDTSYRIAADYDLMTRIILAGKKPVYIPLNYTAFRCGGLSTTEESNQLSQYERLQMRKKIWAPLVGSAAAETLDSGILPPDFTKLVISLVHPVVALDCQACIQLLENHEYVIHNYTRYMVKWDKTITWGPVFPDCSQDSLREIVQLVANKADIRRRYIREKFLSWVTFGKVRKRHRMNRRHYKSLLRKLRDFLRAGI